MGKSECRVQKDVQERAKELITVTTVGTASRSGSFLLSWIHFQVKGLGHLALKGPHSLRLEMIMEQHMSTSKIHHRCYSGDEFQIR